MTSTVLFKIGKYNIYYKQFLFICGLIYVFASWFSAGFYHPDEQFQIIDFAYCKLGLIDAKLLPWEYNEQIRPGLLPLIVTVIYKIFEVFGLTNPFIIAFILRLISASLSLFSNHLLVKIYFDKIGNPTYQKWFIFLAYLLWFSIFLNVRFSSEGISASLFVIAFSMALGKAQKQNIHYLISGILFGLAFIARFQIVFMIVGFGLWMLYQRQSFIKISLIIIGGILAIGAGTIIDRWFYGEWTFSVWNNVNLNLVQDIASHFGAYPFWYYLNLVFIDGIPPFSLIYIAGFFLFIFFKAKHEITWIVVPFFLAHSFIAHKETRFLFPMTPFIPVIIIQSLEIVQQKWIPYLTNKKVFKVLTVLFLSMNFVGLTMVSFSAADDLIPMLRVIYNKYPDNTTLYYIHDHPYENYPKDIFPADTLYLKFYERENLVCKRVKSINDIPVDTTGNILFADVKWDESEEVPETFTQIFSHFPGWIKYFNINNWLSRTNHWQAYEIKTDES